MAPRHHHSGHFTDFTVTNRGADPSEREVGEGGGGGGREGERERERERERETDRQTDRQTETE